MDTACKNGPERNPEESSRPEHYTHYGSEYRAETCDIQKLDKENAPGSKRFIVDVITHRHSRHRPVSVCGKDAVNEHAIDEISTDEDCKRDKKSCHQEMYMVF